MATAPLDPAKPEPQVLDLPSAVMEIRQACDELGSEAHRSPFFFIGGAGISAPPVPLADSIIDHCREVARRYQRDGAPAAVQGLDAYSYWFSRAYPGARQRQQYLRTLIEGKPLSLASLRLAHLLSARRLTNLVVTSNFDDFVARALRLFGTEPAVCDHPRTVGRIDRERDDVQIVHVHGSYLFYDCANLRGEVTDRARADEDSSFTMVGLLDSLLWTRSPLVIGYSGWEGDVIMSALRRRLRGSNPLAQSLYWFCYRRADLDALPDWLKNSPDVRFVLPPAEAAVAGPATPQAAPRGTLGMLGGSATRANADPTAQPRPVPTQPAYAVFDQLNRAFDVGAPALFENPIESFAKSLQAALPGSDGGVGDPYSFKALIDSLNEAAREFRLARSRKPRGHIPELEPLRALMRESQYPQALRQLALIVPARFGQLGTAERSEVVAAAELIARALYGKQGNPFADTPAEQGAEQRDQDSLAQLPAQALVFDDKLDRSLGALPAGVAWLMASHSGHYGLEVKIRGKAHGAFSFHLADALRDPAADADRDGRISLLEAAVQAAQRMLSSGTRQLPAVAGDVERVALFDAARVPGAPRPQGMLRALLVGMDTFPWGGRLDGPPNDLEKLSKLLSLRERRRHAGAQVHQLRNAQATLGAVGREFKALCDASQPDDTLLFHYSGMGWRRDPEPASPEAAPAASSGQTIAMALHGFDEKTGAGVLTHALLLDALATSRAGRKIVILDF